ncbi:MAG: tetratricopeptide repeat protein [Cyclobacteriaceae bacterium]
MRNGFYALFLFVGLYTSHAKSIGQEVYSLDTDLTELVNKTHTERTIILLPFYEWGLRLLEDSYVLDKIDSIDSLSTEYDDKDLQYEVDLLRLHYIVYHEYPSEEIVHNAKELINVARKEELNWLNIRVSSLLGNYYFNDLFEYELGFEYFQITADLLAGLSPEEYPLKSACLHQLAWAHFYFRDYEEAAKNFKLSLDAYRTRLNDYYYIQTINTLGLAHRHLNNLDSAGYYFDMLNLYSIESDNEIWAVISSVNSGYNYFLRMEKEKAIMILQNELEKVELLGDELLYGEILMKLAEIMFSINQEREGKEYTYRAQEILGTSADLSYKAKLFPLLAKAASMDFNPVLASAYIDSVTLSTDSLAEIFSGLKIMRAKQKVLLQKTKNDTEMLQYTQFRELWLRNGGILFLVILLAGGVVSYRKFQVIVTNAKLKNDAETKVANDEIEQLKRLLRKQDTPSDLIKNGHHEIGENEREELIHQLLTSSLLTDKDWHDFVMKFEKVFPGFFHRIGMRWKTLTPTDLRIVALSRIEVDSKGMALMLGVGQDAIRKGKSRLRKKIDLGSEEIFEDVIMSI